MFLYSQTSLQCSLAPARANAQNVSVLMHMEVVAYCTLCISDMLHTENVTLIVMLLKVRVIEGKTGKKMTTRENEFNSRSSS